MERIILYHVSIVFIVYDFQLEKENAWGFVNDIAPQLKDIYLRMYSYMYGV